MNYTTVTEFIDNSSIVNDNGVLYYCISHDDEYDYTNNLHFSMLAYNLGVGLKIYKTFNNCIYYEIFDGFLFSKTQFLRGKKFKKYINQCVENVKTLRDNDICHGDLSGTNIVYIGDKIYFVHFENSFHISEGETSRVRKWMKSFSLITSFDEFVAYDAENVSEFLKCARSSDHKFPKSSKKFTLEFISGLSKFLYYPIYQHNTNHKYVLYIPGTQYCIDNTGYTSINIKQYHKVEPITYNGLIEELYKFHKNHTMMILEWEYCKSD